jgi:membrane-associated phospholipid phosphatase
LQKNHGLNLRNDIAAPLGGEYAFAIDGPVFPTPSWKLVFQVNDPARLQQTFEQVVTEVLKRTTHVERPDGSNDMSFPSGHAAQAFSSATYVHRRYGFSDAWPLYVMATYVGYTRVQSNRHSWVDVAGAAGIAALSSWWLVEPERPAVQVALGRKAVFVAWSIPLP